MDRAWGKFEALPHLEPHRLFGRLGDAPYARPVIQHQMQQPHGLEEVVVVGAVEQLFFERLQRLGHKILWAPTRAGHRLRMLFR